MSHRADPAFTLLLRPEGQVAGHSHSVQTLALWLDSGGKEQAWEEPPAFSAGQGSSVGVAGFWGSCWATCPQGVFCGQCGMEGRRMGGREELDE